MPSLVANTAQTITLAAGEKLGIVSASGVYVVGPAVGSSRPTADEQLDPAGTWIGPVSVATTVTIRPTTAGEYAVSPAPDALYGPESVSYRALVSGAGNYKLYTCAGNSFEQRVFNGTAGVAGTYEFLPRGWLMHLLAKLGSGARIVSSQAVGGAWMSRGGSVTCYLDQTPVAIAAAVAAGAKGVFVGGITNDVVNDVPLATIQAAALTILDQIEAAGLDAEVLLMPGLDPASSAYTAARQRVFYQFNAWMKDIAAGRRRVYVHDIQQVVQNPDGTWKTNLLNGTETQPRLHPSGPAGAMAIGYAVAANIKARGTVFPSKLPITGLDYKAVDSNSPIYNQNALMSGNGGTKSSVIDAPAWVTATLYPAYAMVINAGKAYYTVAGGTSGATAPTHTSGTVTDGTVLWTYIGSGAVAGVADNYTVTKNAGGTCYVCTVDRADGLGKNQVASMAFTAISDGCNIMTPDLKALLVSGKKQQMVASVATMGATGNLRTIRAQLAATAATTSMIRNWGQVNTNGSDPDIAIQQELDVEVATPDPIDFTTAVGAITNFSGNVRMFSNGTSGGAVMLVGRLAIMDVTA